MFDAINDWLVAANAILWHDSVLFVVLGTGILFTVWSGFSQYRALTHGVAVLRGKYSDANDPGAVNQFQALSMALSATVGLGNIGGVALAIGLGGPGAVFWMWVVGFVGMAIKTVEVTMSVMYRNIDENGEPHGGPMYVVSKGIAAMKPELAWLGKTVGVIFCVCLLVSAITGGNMFQAWNVANITNEYFGIPTIVTGIVLATVVGMVIIGGVQRIGEVAGKLVPFMCVLYLLAGLYVLGVNIEMVPTMLKLIVVSAFSPLEASNAFIGGTAGYAFLWGMKRALFSNEAGQGSAPIAMSAAKTDEPARIGILAGMEPFIDTIVVCTVTALVILTSGIWDRDVEAVYVEGPPAFVEVADNTWSMETALAPQRMGANWRVGDQVFVVVSGDANEISGNNLHHIDGTIVDVDGNLLIDWGELAATSQPQMHGPGVYVTYNGATLTAKAFDVTTPGLGMWLVTIAAWLFALSTMISWSYYGEQAMIFLAGAKSVVPYKFAYCAFVILATIGFITTDTELDNLTGFGLAVMLLANLPIMLFFSFQAMRCYHDYVDRLKSGALLAEEHEARNFTDLQKGRND